MSDADADAVPGTSAHPGGAAGPFPSPDLVPTVF